MMDREMPFSAEAEQGVLGCLLLDPAECVPACMERIGSADVFYDFRHRVLYENICAQFSEGGLLDAITVQEQLRHASQLQAVGGMTYVAGLMNCTPSASNLLHYLDIVQRKFVLRTLIQKAASIVSKAYESGEDEFTTLAEAEKAILSIGDEAQRVEGDRTVKEVMHQVLNSLEEAFQNQGKIRGLETGFPDFDWKTYGLKPGQMIIIAARPGVGKTSFAMNIAEHVAVDNKIPTAVFSMEMSSDELLFRMACSRAKIDSETAQSGKFKERDFPKLTSASGQIANSPLHICEKGGLTIAQLSARARRMSQRHKIKLVIVDYLQLMQSRSKENRTGQITEISNGLKALAKDLKVPMIVLSQLSREVEKQDRPPRMSDLRESGAIEQDADIIGLLDPKVGANGEIPDRQEIDLLIPKLRGGKVGRIKLWFNRPFTRFESVSQIDDASY